MYLGAASCISFQDTIGEENPWNILSEISEESQLIQPNYKEFVKPALLRRMSTALKMGVAGGKLSHQIAGVENCDAITVGTGLGCVRDTLRFMKVMYEEEETGLSPTSFIQSTHNSIAGQIALLLGNHGYNMTHVQAALSVGYALSDAELLLAENDAKSVLVGVVDEKTDELVDLLDKLSATANYPLPRVGEGAAFFIATSSKTDSSLAKMTGLSMNKALDVEVDMVLSNTNEGFNYAKFSGEHFASPGFGLFLALKAFEVNEVNNQWVNFSNPQRILVRHSFLEQELSILLERA
jgi:hypothetical protein